MSRLGGLVLALTLCACGAPAYSVQEGNTDAPLTGETADEYGDASPPGKDAGDAVDASPPGKDENAVCDVGADANVPETSEAMADAEPEASADSADNADGGTPCDPGQPNILEHYEGTGSVDDAPNLPAACRCAVDCNCLLAHLLCNRDMQSPLSCAVDDQGFTLECAPITAPPN